MQITQIPEGPDQIQGLVIAGKLLKSADGVALTCDDSSRSRPGRARPAHFGSATRLSASDQVKTRYRPSMMRKKPSNRQPIMIT